MAFEEKTSGGGLIMDVQDIIDSEPNEEDVKDATPAEIANALASARIEDSEQPQEKMKKENSSIESDADEVLRQRIFGDIDAEIPDDTIDLVIGDE